MTRHPASTHPYLRAYMAGVTIPTAFLIVILAVFLAIHGLHHGPTPIERFLVFPLALGPNLWGLWNMLYVAISRRRTWPIGRHGVLLTLIVGPVAWTVATSVGLPLAMIGTAAAVFPFVIVVYYLLWKHGVRFLNELVGVG
jgi:hypothetical protein